MKLKFLLLFQLISCLAVGQSSYFFELDTKNTFKDSRLLLSEDSSYTELLDLKGKTHTTTLHPLYELTYGLDNKEDGFFRWGVGGQINFRSKKVNAGLSYLFSRGEYMSYRTEMIRDRAVLPAAWNRTGVNTIDAQYADAFLNYQPNKIFNFELGYGRKFIGSGHRSLLLSDLASPYPYLRIQTNFWKLKYTNLFSRQMNTYGVVGDNDFYKEKFTATHFLELEFFKKLKVGLFETVVWQSDEGTYKRGFDPNYLNPVIFYRPVEFSIGSSDNVIIGANIDYEFVPNYSFYAQLLIDEFLIDEIRADFNQWRNEDQDIRSGWWGNKYGVQLGLQSRKFAGVEGLMIRLEHNRVRPYTYAHSSPTQAYSHNSLPLAHPLGANFEETILQLRYARKKVTYAAQYNQSRRGVSLLGTNFGEEIERSNTSRIKEYENFIGQGVPVFTRYFDASISRRFKFLWGAEWSLGYVWREERLNSSVDVNTMIYASIKTNVFRSAFDY